MLFTKKNQSVTSFVIFFNVKMPSSSDNFATRAASALTSVVAAIVYNAKKFFLVFCVFAVQKITFDNASCQVCSGGLVLLSFSSCYLLLSLVDYR